MLSPLKIVLLVISSHVLIFLMVYAFENRPTSLYEIYYQEKTNALVKDTSFRNKIVEIDEDGPYKQQINPFKLLDAYPSIPEKLFKHEYKKVHMSIKNEDDYCERVDMYNLMKPANMFENKNFFTDFLNWTIVTEKVIPQIGNVMMDYLTVATTKEELKKAKYPLDMRINNFYLYKDGFYNYHEIGKNFLCQTQMFNHIPGHKTLVRKDEVFDNVNRYLNFYTDKPQCFNRDMVFPQSFRLYVEEECLQFFELIQTENYFDNLENEPFQYIVKVGHGAKFSHAIFMLDEEVSSVIGAEYDFGNACGNKTDTFIIQKYIKNPLLLDNSNKFDFRVFMFIASTNPMIAYYHDGYLRVSLNPFELNSTDLATHVTSTYLAEEIIEQAEAEDWTIFGKTAEELRDYHLWDFSALERYLLDSEKVHDPYWLENYLRPAIKKALVHIVRATSYTFWRQSNVHELYGIDFMLDDNLNLWFMDSTPNPLLTGVKPELIEEMLLNMFEIQYAYYHSRMKRVLDVIYRLQSKLPEIDDEQLRTLQIQYREAVKNRIESEYELSEGNTWSLFIDQNLLPSSDAYYGHVDDECLHPEIDEVY